MLIYGSVYVYMSVYTYIYIYMYMLAQKVLNDY